MNLFTEKVTFSQPILIMYFDSARSDSAGVTCLSLLLALYSQYRGVLLHTYSLHSGGFFPSNKIMQVKCDYKLFPSSCHVKRRKQKGPLMKIFLAFLLSTSSPSPHKPSAKLRWSMIKIQVWQEQAEAETSIIFEEWRNVEQGRRDNLPPGLNINARLNMK